MSYPITIIICFYGRSISSGKKHHLFLDQFIEGLRPQHLGFHQDYTKPKLPMNFAERSDISSKMAQCDLCQ